MITQDVTILPTFNPHVGPITDSSTGSKPDSPIHPLFPKLFLACGYICNSRATFLVIYSGNTYSRCPENPFTIWLGIEWWPGCLKLLMVPTYLALDIVLSFHSRVTFRHHPRCYQPDSQPFRGPFFRSYPLSFICTMKIPKKGWRLDHGDLKQSNEDINERDQPLRKGQPRPTRLVRFSLPALFPPYSTA